MTFRTWPPFSMASCHRSGNHGIKSSPKHNRHARLCRPGSPRSRTRSRSRRSPEHQRAAQLRSVGRQYGHFIAHHHQSLVYGKCIGAKYLEVHKDMCSEEFAAFKDCVQVSLQTCEDIELMTSESIWS